MQAVDAAYPVVSVGRLANYIRRKLGDDPKLRRLGVRGEISGLTVMANGNVYFDLKDRDALVKCIVWSLAAASLPPIANGQEIVAIGSVDTFAKRSSYQLVVVAVEFGGLGRLHALYEALKRRLHAEGLFALERKRALPRFPFRVGLVSSRMANGAGDFIAQAATRAPHVTIELFETPVQGEAAAPEIVRAIDRASRAAVDIVVLARGGGSYEDLFVFNDERVIRALARCAHPTVSAIGHEADAPLTDFVADHRASTPSAAAQTILPQRAELVRSLAASSAALERGVTRTLERTRRRLAQVEVRSPLWAPERLLSARRQRTDAAAAELYRAVEARLRRERARLGALDARLEKCNPSAQLSRRRERLALVAYRLTAAIQARTARNLRRLDEVRARIDPAAHANLARRRVALQLVRTMLVDRDPTRILQRGYAIVSVDGAALRDASTVAPGTRITARLARGSLDARVEASGNDGGQQGGNV
jgi:exodeoxyribonuclease VII large subunit